MKITKKMFIVILIFAIIQMVSAFFLSNEVNAGFFNKVSENGKKWKEMGGNSGAIVNSANGVFDATAEIYVTVRTIGIALFLVDIGVTAISLSMHNNGKDIAGMKLTIGFTLALALLFIFAQPIMVWFQGIFEQLEGTM